MPFCGPPGLLINLYSHSAKKHKQKKISINYQHHSFTRCIKATRWWENFPTNCSRFFTYLWGFFQLVFYPIRTLHGSLYKEDTTAPWRAPNFPLSFFISGYTFVLRVYLCTVSLSTYYTNENLMKKPTEAMGLFLKIYRDTFETIIGCIAVIDASKKL